MAESVDALALGASGATRESSNLSFRTSFFPESARGRKDVIAKDVIDKGATRDVRRAARRMPVYRFEVLR